MKIALVHHTFSRTGGTERYGLDLARGLRDLGDEVHLVARSIQDCPAGVRIHRIMLPVPSAPGPLAPFDRAVARALRREIRASFQPFDVVVGLGRTLRQDVVRLGGGCHAAYLEAVAGVDRGQGGTPRTLSRRNRQRLEWERRVTGPDGPRHIIAVSRRVKAELLDHYAIDAARIQVIHNGVDTERFRPPRDLDERREARARLGLPSDAYAVLFAGNGLYRKGFDVLLEAFQRFVPLARARGVTRNLVLLLVGKDARRYLPRLRGSQTGSGQLPAAQLTPWFFSRLESLPHVRAAQFRESPLRGSRRALVQFGAEIHAPGHLEHIETAYHAADLLVLPSRYEPFGNVCLEALACGLPVVTTRVNGVSEILTGDLKRFVMPSAEAAEILVSHLVTLLDPAVRRELSKQARAIALAHTVRWHAGEVRGLIRALVSGTTCCSR